MSAASPMSAPTCPEQDPVGGKFVNDLGGSRGDASIAFSDLNEDLWSGGVDLSYEIAPRVSATVGYAYSDTHRVATRRSFLFRASNLPLAVQQLRPDYLLSDATIQLYDITMIETSAQDGTAAFDAKLRTHAGYAQLQAEIVPGSTSMRASAMNRRSRRSRRSTCSAAARRRSWRPTSTAITGCRR